MLAIMFGSGLSMMSCICEALVVDPSIPCFSAAAHSYRSQGEAPPDFVLQDGCGQLRLDTCDGGDSSAVDGTIMR